MKHLLLAAVLLLAFSCSEKPKVDDGKNFHLEGTVEGLPDGEQLLVTDGDGFPVDTLTVSQGKFSYSAKTDTVSFYTIFVMNDPSTNVNFFTEPGTVQMKISTKMADCSVGGTTANDALQQLMTETAPYYEKINEIEALVSSDTTLTPEGDWVMAERYLQLYNEIERKMKDAAEKNITNELGYMLVVRFVDEQADADLLEQLIAKMPDNFRHRRPVVKLQAILDSRVNTDEGQVMPDFTLLTPDSTQLSVMGEVKQHKYTIIDFWASWCNPCRAEVPAMRQLYTDFKEKGLGIVSISLDDKAEDWRQAITDLKMEWTQLSDLKGRDDAAARAFRVSTIPYMVVVDSVGTIMKKGLRGDDLRLFISDLLPE
ncbi:MAG: AhpC/TSA family protein [Prevotella sp.]|nr:AhpC/TSA family protein [Prevotella sp.]